MHKFSVAVGVVLGLSLTVAAAQGTLETDEQKTLYALGIALGTNIGPFGLSAEELSVVESGLRDSVLGNEPKVDMQVYGPKIQAFGSQRAAVRSSDGRKTKLRHVC